jgi:hypothetical protein
MQGSIEKEVLVPRQGKEVRRSSCVSVNNVAGAGVAVSVGIYPIFNLFYYISMDSTELFKPYVLLTMLVKDTLN